MAHYFEIEDDKGDLVDLRVFCSDGCHRDYCGLTLQAYKGWNGCHEIDTDTACHFCGTTVRGINNDERMAV